MKKLFCIFAVLFTVSSMLFWGCKKDEMSAFSKSNNSTAMLHPKFFSWSVAEQSFFSLERKDKNGVVMRSKLKEIYHPLLVEAYNQIANDNEAKPFAEEVMKNTGIPAWDKTFVYSNEKTNQNLVMIPVVSEKAKKVTAFISYTKTDKSADKYVIRAVTRKDILEKGGDVKLKYEYARWMVKYDRMLFNTLDKQLDDKRCQYKDLLENPPTGGPPDPTTIVPCSWFLLDICYEAGANNMFFGANVGLYRMYGDHDNDGIINKDDQDYDETINRIGDHDGDGVPNNIDPDWKKWFIQKGDHDNDGIANDDDQDWLDLVTRFPGVSWEKILNNMDDDYGDDWEDRFEDGQIDISGGQTWAQFVDSFYEAMDNISEFFDDVGAWVDGVWHDFGDIWDDVRDWWEDFWTRGPQCPDNFDGLVNKGSGTHTANEILGGRGAVTCDWFYVPVDCDGNINWFGSMLCPTCTIQDFDDIKQKKYYMIQDFIKKNGLTDYSFWFNNLDDFDCNPFNPAFAFDECINKKWLEMVSKETGIPVGTCTNIDAGFAKWLLGNYQQQIGNETMCELYELSLVRPDVSVTIQEIIGCIKPSNNLGDRYYITIGVDDPVNGSSGSTAGGSAGHAFITLEQKDYSYNVIARYTFGFYPNCDKQYSLSGMCKGVLGNDQYHESDVAWEYPISFDKYLKVGSIRVSSCDQQADKC